MHRHYQNAGVASIPLNDPIGEPPPITTFTLKAANNLTINIQSNGDYQLLQNGTTWLQNDATFFQSRGKMYSVDAGDLLLINFGHVESGWDNLGEFASISTTWEAQDCDFILSSGAPPSCTKSSVVTSVRAYKLLSLIVFSQVRFCSSAVSSKTQYLQI